MEPEGVEGAPEQPVPSSGRHSGLQPRHAPRQAPLAAPPDATPLNQIEPRPPASRQRKSAPARDGTRRLQLAGVTLGHGMPPASPCALACAPRVRKHCQPLQLRPRQQALPAAKAAQPCACVVRVHVAIKCAQEEERLHPDEVAPLPDRRAEDCHQSHGLETRTVRRDSLSDSPATHRAPVWTCKQTLPLKDAPASDGLEARGLEAHRPSKPSPQVEPSEARAAVLVVLIFRRLRSPALQAARADHSQAQRDSCRRRTHASFDTHTPLEHSSDTHSPSCATRSTLVCYSYIALFFIVTAPHPTSIFEA